MPGNGIHPRSSHVTNENGDMSVTRVMSGKRKPRARSSGDGIGGSMEIGLAIILRITIFAVEEE